MAKWTGGVAQAVEYLLYKHEALSLNPSPTGKKKPKAVAPPTNFVFLDLCSTKL
jgi:hypothetical protein